MKDNGRGNMVRANLKVLFFPKDVRCLNIYDREKKREALKIKGRAEVIKECNPERVRRDWIHSISRRCGFR